MAIMDFSKAFDTVPHNKHLSKLKHFRINGNTLKTEKSMSSSGWIENTAHGPMLTLES